jgi:hypothetical protein
MQPGAQLSKHFHDCFPKGFILNSDSLVEGEFALRKMMLGDTSDHYVADADADTDAPTQVPSACHCQTAGV